jgi:excisionase family DNA binding protein
MDALLLTTSQLAEWLNVSRPTIYRLLDQGLPAIRLTPGGDRRFDRTDVLKWLDVLKENEAVKVG